MNCDFIEIGTSMYDTLIESATNSTFGISVEPIKHYLDQLPNKANVVKVNAAITSDRKSDTVDLYYIPEDVIDQMGLPYWIKGCNSINKCNAQLINYIQYVKIDKVPLLNISELLQRYNVVSIKYLKIDTEGHDCVILDGLFDYIIGKPKQYYPLKIEFETNHATPTYQVDVIINRAIRFGYSVLSRGHDTILELTSYSSPELMPKLQGGRIRLR